MKISHESPLALLETSRLYNDYDYALVHLFEKYPEYYKFFEESLSLGRQVILDNSIFELGVAFDMDEFYKWVLKLLPTYYIVPDVFDNGPQTIENLNTWRNKYGRNIKDCKEIVVVQGENRNEFLECYQKLYKLNPDMIAFPVNSKSYLNGKNYTPENMMMGRFEMIIQCLSWKYTYEYRNLEEPSHIKHHLLGVSLPQEVKLYKKISDIYSVDTSNPVLHGMEGVWYDNNGCLQIKSSNKMHEMMEWVVTKDQFDIIAHNITKFRNHIN